MACDVDSVALCPFEGPEKLLEVWFAPGPSYVPDASTAPDGKSGLRAVEREVWEGMLNIVKCKILSVVYGEETDAYLLSESSLFISPHRLILKTCGTTLNLLGLPRILAIAREHAGLTTVYQCFYSRKAFMFPDKQLGPHRDWQLEVQFLDRLFEHGAAYAIGKVNQRGDHWLLYMTSPEDGSVTDLSSINSSICISNANGSVVRKVGKDNWAVVSRAGLYTLPLLPPTQQDYTIEILMTHLSPRARAAFFTPDWVDPCCTEGDHAPGDYALRLSNDIGITDIFPRRRTQLDAYSFTPCGYSANALIKWGDAPAAALHAPLHEDGLVDSEGKIGEGYYTIHVTPEEGWSYASFECNVPLAARRRSGAATDNADDIPDLHTLVRRVLRIFEPGKITMTLFVQSHDDVENEDENDTDEGETETAVEAAQRAFKAALTRPPESHASPGVASVTRGTGVVINDGGTSTMPSPPGGGPGWAPACDRVYKRTDKINYEFGGYDLAFASFEAI